LVGGRGAGGGDDGEGINRGRDNHGGVEGRGTEGERTVSVDQGTTTSNAYKAGKCGKI